MAVRRCLQSFVIELPNGVLRTIFDRIADYINLIILIGKAVESIVA